ncbi:RING finger protein nhl-1-like [Mya arenaria]|nr:RING finger protein nhl-1-like [Mya arenaria]XP_052792662.1 RING finger protein nhl-1-like [Mya arenaria]XP_052792664.1 RING finger protein nhl-1-like [Mya arenaria]XP_052792665.1 RING finger protein nhl-1-like [Mya arenaria]
MASGDDGAAGKRNLVVDEGAFEEQFLRCHICREKYDQTEKPPKSLPCNHTFCLACLTQIYAHTQTNQRRALAFADETVLKCPTCREETYVSRREEIANLPNDHRVIQMIDFLSQVVVKSQNFCSKHEQQPLNFFCKSCMVPVCRDCTVLDHKENSDHVIVDVAKALEDNADEFNNVENRSKQLLQGMKSRSDALANASKQLDLLERQLRSKIKDTFIEYRLLLERRQEGQIAILHDVIKKQKSLINARFVDVCTQGSQLQKLYDAFTKARPSNDITQLFTVHKEMKEHDAEFARQSNVNDDELFVGCDFEVINEPIYLSEMSCLGEVVPKPDLGLKKPVPAHQLAVLDMEADRRMQEAQGPDLNDYDDLYVETSRESRHARDAYMTGSRTRDRHGERDRHTDRVLERSARLRAQEIINRESQHDQDRDVDEAEEMEHDSSDFTSAYLLRIASRLNASSANLSEAILDLSSNRDTTRSPEDETPTSTSGGSRGTRRAGPSPPRSRRSGQNVRVVRHPQQYRPNPDRTDRFISSSRTERSNTDEN